MATWEGAKKKAGGGGEETEVGGEGYQKGEATTVSRN